MAIGLRSGKDGIGKKPVRGTRTFAVWLVVLACMAWPSPLFAAGPVQSEKLSVTDIVEQAQTLDGRTVMCEGEIIGDMMRRGDHVWINVLDNQTALGIWARAESLPGAALAGDYGKRGDEVRVIGIFNRACSEHGGDGDIHATEVIQVAPGSMVAHPLNPLLVITALLAFCLAMVVLLLDLRRRSTRGGLLRRLSTGDSPHRLP